MTRVSPDLVDRHYDHAFVVETLVTLARTPADVPLGQNEIEPTDPKIAHYVQDNLICGFGSGAPSPSLLVMAYTTAQHGNYTDPALEGRLVDGREYGVEGDCVVGKGTSQNKGALAAMLGALKILADAGVRLRGSLHFVVNTESQSSHRCSVRVIDGHGLRADAGWLAIGVPWLVLGHRGRVDVYVTIRGAAGHSSEPHLGKNAIWGLAEALERLRGLKGRLTRRHPDLGGEQVEPYKLVTAPIAPHTMPGEAHLVVDRRLLPGTDADAAVDEVRAALGDIPPYEVIVRKGVHHMPYQVSPDLPHVRALAAAHRAVRGKDPDMRHSPFAFDAGYCPGQKPHWSDLPVLRRTSEGAWLAPASRAAVIMIPTGKEPTKTR